MHLRNALFIFMLLVGQSYGMSSLPPPVPDTTPLHAPDSTPQPPPEDTTPTPEPEDCAGTIEQCQDVYGNSPQARSDLLVLRQCITTAPCDGNDDDTAAKDRALFVVNSNDFHWIPADDPGESNAVQAMSSSTLSITISLLLMLTLTYH